MKIRENMKSIYMGEMTKENDFGIKRREHNSKSEDRIFAGGFRENNDELAMKRKQAQTKAYKIVSDANNGETSIDNIVDQRKQHISELEASSAQTLKGIKDYQDKIEELKEKNKDSLESSSSNPLGSTDGQSDYEKELQVYEQAIEKLSKEVKNNQDNIDNERMSLNAIALGRLKEHGMVDAQKFSDTILEAASKDIVGSLMKEAVDQVEENIKDVQEKQDKIEEEKEKKEKIESEKENKTNEDEKQQSVDGKQEISNHRDVLKQLNKVLVDEKLVEEDLKGIILDEQI